MNINWTDINLPYSTDIQSHQRIWDEVGESPDIEADVRDKFGTTRGDLYNQHKDKIRTCSDVRDSDIHDKIMDEHNFDTCTKERYEACEAELDHRFALWLHKNPEYQEAWKAQLIRREILDFKNTHPAKVAHDARYYAAKAKEDAKTFAGQGLALPGVLIELENGKVHLLGSVNCQAGACDDCSDFGPTDIVKRYAIIIDFTALQKQTQDWTDVSAHRSLKATGSSTTPASSTAAPRCKDE